MAFLKPQSPLARGDDYFYPLTTADQVILSNGLRMEDMVGKTRTQTITLYQNGWSAQAPYCYSITIQGLNDKIPARVYPVYPSDVSLDSKIAYKEELAKITHCERDGMIMTFECWEDVPAMDLVVEVEMSVLYPLEGSINMDDIESLLPKINYSVVGGTTEPSNPTENMIWINTDTEITGYIFSKNEPKNPIEGMIWIECSSASTVAFHSLKVNGKYENEVYPIAAKQYINNIWVNKFSKTYQNEEWQEWMAYIYKYGNEYNDTTGGWALSSNYGGSSHGDTISKTANSMTFSSSFVGNSHFALGYLRTNNLIKLDDVSMITAILKNVSINSIIPMYFCISEDDSATPSAVVQTNILTGDTKVSLDVATIKGEYRVGFSAGMGSSSASSTISITEIYFT